ncbi:MAG: hypothetical protein ACYS0D_09085 [Planctomycetota bacterium]|jgi:opacity protein-like surface antigen
MTTRATAIVLGSLLGCAAAVFGQTRPLATFRKSAIPDTGTFTVGVEYERIFARDLDDAGVSGTELDANGAVVGTIEAATTARGVELESNAILVRLGYSIAGAPDRTWAIEGYSILGAADLTLDGTVNSPGDAPETFNVDGDFGVVFGGGMRSQVYRRGRLRVFVDGSIRFSYHDSGIVPVAELDLVPGPGETAAQDFETRLLSWQVSGYVAWDFELGDLIVAPYGGFRLSGLEARVDGSQGFFDPDFDGLQTLDYGPHQEDVFGLFAGVEVGITGNLGAFVEVRFIDELAITAGGSVTF